jgi:hypothetical protein
MVLAQSKKGKDSLALLLQGAVVGQASPLEPMPDYGRSSRCTGDGVRSAGLSFGSGVVRLFNAVVADVETRGAAHHLFSLLLVHSAE